MKLFIDTTKFELGKLFGGLGIYVRLMERQMPAIEKEQAAALGSKWEEFQSVFTEELPRNLRYSCLVLLVTNAEWSINHAVGLLEKKGVVLPPKPKNKSKIEHKLAFLNHHKEPAFEHPFEKTFEAITQLRNAIVHSAGKPQRCLQSHGPFDIRTYDKKVREAANSLSPLVVLEDNDITVLPGALNRWVVEAEEWLSALYDHLQFQVGFELSVAPEQGRT